MEEFDLGKIDDYLLGQLAEYEQQQVVQQINSSEEFAELVQQRQDFLQGIELFGEQQFIEELKKKDTELAANGFFLTESDIDDYVNNNANISISNLVKKRMQMDDDFAREIVERTEIVTGINVFGEQDFLKKLQQTDDSLEQEAFFTVESQQRKISPRIVKLKRRRWLSIAAAVAGLLIIIVGVIQFFTHTNIFNRNFVAYEDQLSNYLTESGFVRPAYLDDLLQGMNFYNQQKYQVAQNYFNQYLNVAPSDDQFYLSAQFYLAQTYLINKEVEIAIPLLENLIQRSDFQWSAAARWYLALSYVENGQKDRAQPILRQLLNNKEYAVRAKKLL